MRWRVPAFGLALTVVFGVFPVWEPTGAYWTDDGAVTSAPITTWGLTSIDCHTPSWGTTTQLSWSDPGGGQFTVTLALDPTSDTPGGLSYWTTAAPQPGTPLHTTGTTANWGISTYNPVELGHFHGTWELDALAPGGVWTASRSGTWDINYQTQTSTCTVDP